MAGLADSVVAILDGLALIERELLAFAAFWFTIGLLDEFGIDLAYLWLRLTGRARTPTLPTGFGQAPLLGQAAVLIPAYRESTVIADTIAHALAAWPQAGLRLYIGCYRNDAATIAAAMAGAGSDPRVRLVIHGADGPTTKADCLNRLHAALCADEARQGFGFRSVLLHDAEDMVHPAALQAIDAALDGADFVQVPVRPLLPRDSRWIAAHYADEFAESHAKALVVRSVLRAGLPAAGVGCGFARAALAELARHRAADGGSGPFATECLTEDYELGLRLSQGGRGGRLLRVRDADGALVATGSFFPARLSQSVRQKTRWVHGIAFQSWERLGWPGRPIELWMALRDRRGPLTALVLIAAYALLLIEAVLFGAEALTGRTFLLPLSPVLRALLLLSFAGFAWRATMRWVFTMREYGAAEGVRAVLRIPLANIIAIMAGRRALAAYLRSLRDGKVAWDKTDHAVHPATSRLAEVRA